MGGNEVEERRENLGHGSGSNPRLLSRRMPGERGCLFLGRERCQKCLGRVIPGHRSHVACWGCTDQGGKS